MAFPISQIQRWIQHRRIRQVRYWPKNLPVERSGDGGQIR